MENPNQFEQRLGDAGGANTEKVESVEDGLSFEWGPELGKMSWKDAQEKIAELNKTLEGEKPWRLPTEEEWIEVLKPFTEADEKGASKEELEKILEEIRQKHNLQSDFYWSSPIVAGYSGDAWIVSTKYGEVGGGYSDLDNYLVRCVR